MTRVLLAGGDSRLLHLFGCQCKSLDRIFVGKPLGAGELVHAVIGLWRHYIVVHLDDLAVLGRDERCGVVAVPEVRTFLASAVFDQFLAVEGASVHRYQRFHAVAAVDVQHLGDGSKAMGGIYIPAELAVVVQTPSQLVVSTFLPVFVPIGRQLVAVCPLHVDNLAHQALLRHVQRIELKEIITAVLKHHHVQALALAQVDERPYFGHVHRRGHLDGDVMAMFQRLARHQIVVEPVCGDIHKIDVAAAAQVLIAVFPVIDIGGGHRSLAQYLLAGLGAVLLMVTQGFHLDAGDMCPALHRIGPAHTQSHKRHPHDRNLLHRESQRRLQPRRPLRHLRHDGPVLNRIMPVELCPNATRQQRNHRQYNCNNISLSHDA